MTEETKSSADLDRLIPSLCTRCGKCCLPESGYMDTLSATTADMRRWRREKRADILAYADDFGRTSGGADLWFKPDGRECSRCPFVRRERGRQTYRCGIYETRPEVCRDYPISYEQMELIGCEIIGELEARGIDARGWDKHRRGDDGSSDDDPGPVQQREGAGL